VIELGRLLLAAVLAVAICWSCIAVGGNCCRAGGPDVFTPCACTPFSCAEVGCP
jgi:hypothetical protein